MEADQDAVPTWSSTHPATDNQSDQWLDSDQHLLGLFQPSRNSLTATHQDYFQHLQYYLLGIGGTVVCSLGTVANVLSIAVLTRRSMSSSTYTYLTALAVCDTLVLFLTLVIAIHDARPPESLAEQSMDRLHALLFPFVHPCAVVFQVTSIWLTLAFTVDRYIMICHPFSAERMCRRSRARTVTVALYVAGLLFNIPRFLEYTTSVEYFPFSNSSQLVHYGVLPTPLGSSELFREIIHSWLYLLFICGIPFLTLVILNVFLIRAVHLSRQRGRELNARDRHRNDTTIMLIGVIVLFLICQGPALVSRMVYAFRENSVKTLAGFTLNEVGNFLVLLNSAINIVPYYLFGRKFRSEFLRIFCPCCLDVEDRRMVRNYSLSLDQRGANQYNAMEMNGSNRGLGQADDSQKNATRHINCSNGASTGGVTTSLLHNGDHNVTVTALPVGGSYSSLDSIKRVTTSLTTSDSSKSPVTGSIPIAARVNLSGQVHYITASSDTKCTHSAEWVAV